MELDVTVRVAHVSGPELDANIVRQHIVNLLDGDSAGLEVEIAEPDDPETEESVYEIGGVR